MRIKFIRQFSIEDRSLQRGESDYSNLSKSWFEFTTNAVTLSEILQNLLNENNEGGKINLAVLLDDREVRNDITHRGDTSIWLSAIRCHNVIRDMILFIEPEQTSRFPKFTYPEKYFYDMQASFSHTNNMEMKDRTNILIAGSLHDIPAAQKFVLANAEWDIAIDTNLK